MLSKNSRKLSFFIQLIIIFTRENQQSSRFETLFNHSLLYIGGFYIIGQNACRGKWAALTSHQHDLFSVILMKIFVLFVGEVIRLSDVKDFPATLWLIFIICVAYYVAIFPFIALGL